MLAAAAWFSLYLSESALAQQPRPNVGSAPVDAPPPLPLNGVPPATSIPGAPAAGSKLSPDQPKDYAGRYQACFQRMVDLNINDAMFMRRCMGPYLKSPPPKRATAQTAGPQLRQAQPNQSQSAGAVQAYPQQQAPYPQQQAPYPQQQAPYPQQQAPLYGGNYTQQPQTYAVPIANPQELASVINQNLGDLRTCYENFLGQMRELGLFPGGRITVHLDILPTGETLAVLFEADSLPDVGLLACVRARIKNWQMPRHSLGAHELAVLQFQLSNKHTGQGLVSLARGFPQILSIPGGLPGR